MEHGVLGHERLPEQHCLLGIEAGGEPVDDHVVDVVLERRGVLVVRGEGVQVGDDEEAVVFVLQAYPVLQRTVVVAEVQGAGGAHAGQDSGAHVADDSKQGNLPL